MSYLPKIDLDELSRLGRLSNKDAEELHACLCNQAGLHDADEIKSQWLRRCEDGPYVQELTDLVLKFMEHKLAEKREL